MNEAAFCPLCFSLYLVGAFSWWVVFLVTQHYLINTHPCFWCIGTCQRVTVQGHIKGHMYLFSPPPADIFLQRQDSREKVYLNPGVLWDWPHPKLQTKIWVKAREFANGLDFGGRRDSEISLEDKRCLQYNSWHLANVQGPCLVSELWLVLKC